jgi:hypothetical protein
MIEALEGHKLQASEGDLVFTSSVGTALEPRFDKLFKQVLQRANLPQEIRLHSARHFGLSLLAALGVHPKNFDGTGRSCRLENDGDDLQPCRLG